ncbi:MAG: hypothetical protein ABJH98_06925 [Reichenbachiella sp.]|uniref:hypothetical protein n=1 Tax=Reichenbachiella sp. TaxID=2184521 RepID=UPI003299FAB7
MILRNLYFLLVFTIVFGCASRKYSADFQQVNGQSQRHDKNEDVLSSGTEDPNNYQWAEEDSLLNPDQSRKSIETHASGSTRYTNQYQRIDSLHAEKLKNQSLDTDKKSPKQLKSKRNKRFWPVLVGSMLLAGAILGILGIIPALAGILIGGGLVIGFSYLVQQAISKGDTKSWLNLVGALVLIVLTIGALAYFYAIKD